MKGYPYVMDQESQRIKRSEFRLISGKGVILEVKADRPLLSMIRDFFSVAFAIGFCLSSSPNIAWLLPSPTLNPPLAGQSASVEPLVVQGLLKSRITEEFDQLKESFKKNGLTIRVADEDISMAEFDQLQLPQPRYKLIFSGNTYYISSLSSGLWGRDTLIIYLLHKDSDGSDKKMYARVIYRSLSQATWRVASHLASDGGIGKGFHTKDTENFVTMPLELQPFFEEICSMKEEEERTHHDVKHILSKRLEDDFLIEPRGRLGIFTNEIDPRSFKIFRDDEYPDFENGIQSTFSIPETIGPEYGKIRAYLIRSKNGKLLYQFSVDSRQSVWIADIQFRSRQLNSFGIRVDVMRSDDLLCSPVREYASETPPGPYRYTKIDLDDRYVDISSLLHQNPLIRVFREKVLGIQYGVVTKERFLDLISDVRVETGKEWIWKDLIDQGYSENNILQDSFHPQLTSSDGIILPSLERIAKKAAKSRDISGKENRRFFIDSFIKSRQEYIWQILKLIKIEQETAQFERERQQNIAQQSKPYHLIDRESKLIPYRWPILIDLAGSLKLTILKRSRDLEKKGTIWQRGISIISPFLRIKKKSQNEPLISEFVIVNDSEGILIPLVESLEITRELLDSFGITDETKEVISRKHLRIQQEGDDIILTDLDSTNGTYIFDAAPSESEGIYPDSPQSPPDGLIESGAQMIWAQRVSFRYHKPFKINLGGALSLEVSSVKDIPFLSPLRKKIERIKDYDYVIFDKQFNYVRIYYNGQEEEIGLKRLHGFEVIDSLKDYIDTRHAELTFKDNTVIIEDFRSRYGTYITFREGQQLEPQELNSKEQLNKSL